MLVINFHMFRVLFLVFVIVPLIELYVLIEVGSGIGGLTTIVLCLLTAAAGGLIIRWQGMQTLLNARKSMLQAQHHQLAEHGMHGMMLVFAGVLLFVPGFITDTIGFLLLVPSVRRVLMRTKRFDKQDSRTSRYSHVIEADIIKHDKDSM